MKKSTMKGTKFCCMMTFSPPSFVITQEQAVLLGLSLAWKDRVGNELQVAGEL